MIIETSRLVIRPSQRADLDVMATWPPFPDPLDAVWNWPHALHEQGTTDLFFHMRASDPTRREWTITTTTQSIIGYVHLRSIPQDKKRARLGIGFGYPYLGLGYGTEALRTFLPSCFGNLGIQRIELDVASYNVRARRMYHQLGFRAIKTIWRPLGAAVTHTVIEQPAYAAIRPLLRSEDSTLYVLCVEMMLRNDEVHSSLSH